MKYYKVTYRDKNKTYSDGEAGTDVNVKSDDHSNADMVKTSLSSSHTDWVVENIEELQGICNNCKYWKPNTNPGYATVNGFAMCNLSIGRNKFMGSGCGLRTVATFGCNQFLPAKA